MPRFLRFKKSMAFTLIEVMVALVILTIAAGAIIENTTASNRNTQYLRDRTLAQWVAYNEIALYRAKRIWGNTSNRKGRTNMAGREWIWSMQILATDDPSLRRLVVSVSLADQPENVISTIDGFSGKI